MKKVLLRGAALAFLITLVPHMVMAADETSYVTGKVGAYFPTGDLNDNDFDPGFSGEIGYGYYLLPNLAAEGSIGYYSSQASDQFIGGYYDDNRYRYYHGDFDVAIVPISLTLKATVQMDMVELYAGGGVDLFCMSIDAGNDAGYSDDDDSDAVFGAHIVAGGNVDIGNNMYIGLEAKYLLTDEVDVSLFENSYSYDLDGFTVTGTFGYRF